MTDLHPITPPPDLVQQWRNAAPALGVMRETWISTEAARWGADQELEACCEWLVRNYNYPEAGNPLRAARRPKPPSLKEQALDALEQLLRDPEAGELTSAPDTIRRAIEALPND